MEEEPQNKLDSNPQGIQPMQYEHSNANAQEENEGTAYKFNIDSDILDLFHKSDQDWQWLATDWVEFHDQIVLEMPEDCKALLQYFTSNQSRGALPQVNNNLYTVLKFLTKIFHTRFLTANRTQLRFAAKKFKFFWNYTIIKEFAKTLETPGNYFYFAGPQNLGKSFNFALFRNILCSDSQNYRVIYIHNLEDWFKSYDPIEWILKELMFTFATELKDVTYAPEIVPLFDQCFNNSKDHEKACSNLERLMLTIKKRKKLGILLIDQYNVIPKYRNPPGSQKPTKAEEAAYETVLKIIERILPKYCEKIIKVASLTDEGTEKLNPNVTSVTLVNPMPREMCIEYIKENLENGLDLSEEHIQSVLDSSNGYPGEILEICKSEGPLIPTKIAYYNRTRLKRIKQDFLSFESKRVQQGRSQEEVREIMAKLAVYVNMGIRLTQVPLDMYYDKRFIKDIIENDNYVDTYIPLAAKALRDTYTNANLLINMMELCLASSLMSAFGSIYELFMIKKLTEIGGPEIVGMRLKKYNQAFQDYRIQPMTTERFISIDSIDFDKIKVKTLLEPESKCFEDIDFIIVNPTKKEVSCFQAKYHTGLYLKWLSFCQGKKNLQDKHPESPTRKETLFNYLKNKGFESVQFVFMYLVLREKSFEIFQEKVAKNLGADICICDTHLLAEFKDLKLQAFNSDE